LTVLFLLWMLNYAILFYSCEGIHTNRKDKYLRQLRYHKFNILWKFIKFKENKITMINKTNDKSTILYDSI